MEVEGSQYALKFRDTVEDLPGDLKVLTTSIVKATDWVLWAVHHNPLTIDGGDAFMAQMTSFVNAVMATDFSRIRGPGELDNFSLASLLEAETSSKDEPTIHPAPVFKPPPPGAHGPLDEGVAGVGAPPYVLMQALDDLGRPASPSCIPASKKRKGVDCLVPPPPQKKSKVAYSCPGPPPPINRATKPKPRPTTWAGIAKQAAPMPPPPPGLGPQRRRPSPPPVFPTGPMKTSPHRSVPSFTSEGPTWKQVLVSFGGTPPDLTKFFTESAVRAANGYLRDGRSMLKVTSIVRAYDSLSLVTPAVASPSDLDILRNFIRESLPTGTPFEVALPVEDHLSVCRVLKEWFEADDLRRVTFVYVPSALRWDIHGEAHKYVTELKVRVGRRKTDNSIDTLRSRAAHSVLDSWSSTFQDPTYRGSEFLELQQPDGRPLQPSYLNGGPWLSTFGHSITEFARVCRCITGHAPIGAYYRRFKINEPHGCTCGAALQSRQHILFRCRDRYSVHYPRFLGDIASFMKYNPTAFGFNRDPSGVG
ncbi:unnamed protein product [Cyclocybe aegerita]|uniref:Uncharacterized protein n=1 Tax=Cyclocybe aegerita TaxID=1973307 RepID=A0A8S0WFL2_CYCAE|nr:unnamed protein product [Cyclocybe aegerita]